MKKRSPFLSKLFRYYNWFRRITDGVLNVTTPGIRMGLLKLMLGSLGEQTWIDYEVYFRYPWQIHIGSRCKINRKCAFYTSYYHRDVSITIGDHVQIAPEVSFFAASHDYTKLNRPDTAASIDIGDEAWIGARSVILPGTKIGKGAVIGAGSIVTRDIPEWSIAVGSPARVVKKREICDLSETDKE